MVCHGEILSCRELIVEGDIADDSMKDDCRSPPYGWATTLSLCLNSSKFSANARALQEEQ
jgi:hypothetical protein